MNMTGRSRFAQQEQAEGTASEAADYVARGYEQAGHAVAENPEIAMIVSFSVGLGLGVLLSSLFGEEPSTMSRLRNRWQESTEDSTIERVGRQIMDSITRMLPESVASHLPR